MDPGWDPRLPCPGAKGSGAGLVQGPAQASSLSRPLCCPWRRAFCPPEGGHGFLYPRLVTNPKPRPWCARREGSHLRRGAGTGGLALGLREPRVGDKASRPRPWPRPCFLPAHSCRDPARFPTTGLDPGTLLSGPLPGGETSPRSWIGSGAVTAAPGPRGSPSSEARVTREWLSQGPRFSPAAGGVVGSPRARGHVSHKDSALCPRGPAHTPPGIRGHALSR